jgi:hypothetical protein
MGGVLSEWVSPGTFIFSPLITVGRYLTVLTAACPLNYYFHHDSDIGQHQEKMH